MNSLRSVRIAYTRYRCISFTGGMLEAILIMLHLRVVTSTALNIDLRCALAGKFEISILARHVGMHFDKAIMVYLRFWSCKFLRYVYAVIFAISGK